MAPTNPQHNDDCFKGYLVRFDKETGRVYAAPNFRQRWDCPACASWKISEITKHIVAKTDRLCWGLHTNRQRVIANSRRIGWLSIGYLNDARIMVAESHLYEPLLPSEQVIQDIIRYTSSRQVTRVGWAEKWRPPEGDANRYENLDTKERNLKRVQTAMQRAGIIDGRLGNKSVAEVKSNIEQILNGVGKGNWV